MKLQLIGAAFGRTGTLSLKLALELLGFGPCLHMSQFVTDNALCRIWLDELNRPLPDWQSMVGENSSLLDWPCCLFVEQFLALAPDAKVIYTERDFDSWFRSLNETIVPALRWANQLRSGHRPGFIAFAAEIIGKRTFGENFERAAAERIYHNHRERVIGQVPAGQLLMFDVRDGWGPLCDFLEVREPNFEFPQENAAGEFFAMLRSLHRKRING
ncbi:sulfotransferase family protein [Microbulbifer hainanensis]|uniref:sulfotransferase family protein n=1 Tax=Microbulbifer hainanensis TaxID=2735675 RepID=UPI001865CA49|nr:sulfotransferase family protein [Microbulbifer hainanensis]